MSSKYSVTQAEIEDLRRARQKRIEYLRERAAEIELVPLPRGQAYKAVAVSVNVSNVPIEMDVFDGMLIRCLNSDGEEYFQHFVLADGPDESVAASAKSEGAPSMLIHRNSTINI